MTEPLVQITDLVKHFPVRGGFWRRVEAHVRAVDGVTLSIPRRGTVGIVGESGCGKTTLGRTVLRLTDPTSGTIRFAGQDITRMRGRALQRLRRRMQIVFQDPLSSLNPRMTVRQILSEPLKLHGWSRRDVQPRVAELLDTVGLRPDHADRFPHEFSGGQRQRIGVARALALRPEFVVLDEPTSALDVSVQAQILNLLGRLQNEFSLTYLLISHDLAVVRHLCTDVAVMYLGRIVEQGPVEQVFDEPQHPYTQALLSAVPIPDPARRAARIVLPGDVPSPLNPPPACRFNPRCPRVRELCRTVEPQLERKATDHLAACHYPGPSNRWAATTGNE